MASSGIIKLADGIVSVVGPPEQQSADDESDDPTDDESDDQTDEESD